jgi:hypothetical protein
LRRRPFTLDDLRIEVRERAMRLAGQHVSRIETPCALGLPFIPAADAAFETDDRVMRIALLSERSPLVTVRHESIHALRHAGVFFGFEWENLERHAHDHWMRRFSIEPRYSDFYRQQFHLTARELRSLLLEEAICDGIAEYQWRDRMPDHLRNTLTLLECGAVGLRVEGAGADREFVLRPRND